MINSPTKKTVGLVTSLGLAASVLAYTVAGPVFSQSPEMISRAILEGMARNQYDVLCNSEAFTACMGFVAAECSNLADEAIKQCLLPLPTEISLEALDNSAIESCPKEVFADAGYSEEKAGRCFDEAIANQ